MQSSGIVLNDKRDCSLELLVNSFESESCIIKKHYDLLEIR